jgi:RecA-family ATPase
MNKYAENIGVIAQELWGEPNKTLSRGHDVRFGSQGSKSVDTEKGTFYDHETGESGGFVDLYKLARPHVNGNLADALEKEFGMDKDPQFQKRGKDVITVYDYVGDHGILEYQVVRTDFEDGKKTFRQQRPDGQGGWIKNLKGIERIPYNLPAVLHHKERIVFVVEGEKAADKLKDIGLLATTNNGGSGQWTEEHAKWLKGRRVVVLPDNDEVGVKHGAKVINTLIGVAKEIRLLDLSDQLPPKGDIVDWLNSGKTKDQLFALVKKAQLIEDKLPDPGEIEPDQIEVYPTMAIGELMAMPPIKFLVESLYTRHGFSVMWGPPGCGKTFLALDVALCVATGQDFHDMSVEQGSVLYIAGEGVGGIGKRVKAWIENRGVGVNENELPFYVLPTAVDFTNPADVEKLSATIQLLEERAGGFSLIVVDTVARALLGADENSATDIGKFVKSCDVLKQTYNTALIGIHHSGKDGSKGMRGSSALLGAVDTSIQIKKSGAQITMTTEKQKDAEPADDYFFEMQSAEVGTIGGETSVYLRRLTADEVAAGKTTLNETQLKAMNCLRDATDRNDVISVEVARDSFIYWMAEKEEVDVSDSRLKDRARKAWKRSIEALESADIIVVRGHSKKIEWIRETDKVGHDSDKTDNEGIQ